MRLAPIAILSFVVLIAACSEDPNTQSQSQSEPSGTKAITESSQPTPAVEAPKSEPIAQAPAPTPAAKAPAPVAKAPTPTVQTPAAGPIVQTTRQAKVTPGLVPGATKLDLGEYLLLSDDIFEEKCEIDPVTGKKVCTSGLCWAFGGLCDQFPFSVMQIPANIALSNAKTVLGVAKSGLETTEAGAAFVQKATNIIYRVRRAINALMTDPPEAYNTMGKPKGMGAQAMIKPKVTYQGAN